MINIGLLKETLKRLSFIKNINGIDCEDSIIRGSIVILFDGLESSLNFRFEIYPPYPLKYHGSESIKFYNEDLISVNHVMQDGSICIHNSHNTDIKQKILMDFDSLKQWIQKYYIDKENDLNYEHIVVEEGLVEEKYYSYIFTDIGYVFSEGNFGQVKIFSLNNTLYKDKEIENFLVQKFIFNKSEIPCKWNSHYKNIQAQDLGLFYFLDKHPAKMNKFIFNNWSEFQELVSNKFLNYLYQFEQKHLKHFKGYVLPLFFGYRTVNNEIHWQVALIKVGAFPIKGEAEVLLGIKTGKWNTTLIDSDIRWALTRDSSYKYFFGRGTLDKSITESKILIIGLGAIGSMVAKTLTRGGCKYIDIVDYDTKEPENVCRSEYLFQSGLCDKVREIESLLIAISPFVEVTIIKKEYFELIAKMLYKDMEARSHLIATLNEYDIVFDCTTDNDLMHILETFELTAQIINMSITNHAQELVCAFSPNIYNFVNTQFSEILNNDLEDLYEPTGCWNPTFKASYNDINTLVQFAIKHINNIYKNSKEKNNFLIGTNADGLTLEIKEY